MAQKDKYFVILWERPTRRQYMTEKILSSIYKRHFGVKPESCKRLPESGSNRKYFRLSGSQGSAIGVRGTDCAENERYLALSEIFKNHHIRVADVLGCADGDFRNQYYLLEDLGATSLFDLLSLPSRMIHAKAAIQSLAKIHTLDIDSDDFKKAGVILRSFSEVVMFDLNYFKYEFIKPAGAAFDEFALEEDFRRLASEVADLPDTGFMYRDCQSRNVMMPDGSPAWIDFQGALRGPALYDVVSFLWQARAGFSPSERLELLAAYLSAAELQGAQKRKKEDIRNEVDLLALLRTLQVLGAYGFRGLVERKAHFIASIPEALKNLKDLAERGVIDKYPELKHVCASLTANPRFESVDLCHDCLNVNVYSFSYKKGYPEDLSGNGGGFMFDCRAMHNPGRYDEYKNLTGLDIPVIEFLESRGEVQAFVDKAVAIISPSIERYLQRNFNSLQIGFGCTGGQHRSVYCAEHAAAILAEKFPKGRVTICHREQGIKKTLK